MVQGISLFVYPVKDIAQAKTLYSRLLGVEPFGRTSTARGYPLEKIERARANTLHSTTY